MVEAATGRTSVRRDVKPGITPEVVALGTVLWLPVNARNKYRRRNRSNASL